MKQAANISLCPTLLFGPFCVTLSCLQVPCAVWARDILMLTILSCSRCRSLDSKPRAASGHFLARPTSNPRMNTHVCVCESLHATDSRVFDLCKEPDWWEHWRDILFRGTELRTTVLCLDSILVFPHLPSLLLKLLACSFTHTHVSYSLCKIL